MSPVPRTASSVAPRAIASLLGSVRRRVGRLAILAACCVLELPANAQSPAVAPPPPPPAAASAAAAASRLPAATGAAVAEPAQNASLTTPGPSREDRLGTLRRIGNWGYQLKAINKSSIAASPFDLMVIDYAPDRTSGREEPFTRAELAAMQRKPDGKRRLVFAYFSIGEAERYRTYWQQSWYSSPPAWLGPENPQWPGNYPVRFWSNEWQGLLFGAPRAYLDRILAAGFDGIYIDRADISEYWLKSRPSARADMASLVAGIAAYARTKRPETLVLMQNAEELLDIPRLRDAIDGVAKEDLFYGINHDQSANSSGDVAASVDLLQRLKRRGKSILVVEYLTSDGGKAEDAIRRSRKLGYVPLIAERSLANLPRAAR